MKKLSTLIISASLLAVSTIAPAADGPHDKAIKARIAAMQLYGYHLGILGAMVKGKMDYNAELAAEAAGNLAAVNSMGQSTLWPAGSDNADPANAKTRALPAIWDTYPEIAEKGKNLTKAVTTLASVAGNGLDALKDSFGPVGKSCKGCHDDFRAEKK